MGATIRMKIPDNTKLKIKGLLNMLSMLSQQYHAVEVLKMPKEKLNEQNSKFPFKETSLRGR